MSEFILGYKLGVASVLGGVLSMGFIKMSPRRRFVAVISGAIMAHYIGAPVSEWTGLEESATGFLIGLFGVSICSLIFEGIQKSDLSFKFSDIVDLFRR